MDSGDRGSPELDLEKLRVMKVLGKGAMGVVFLVDHSGSDPGPDPIARRRFAVKVVEKSSFRVHAAAERRARWELALLTRLSSTRRRFLPHLISSAESEDYIAWSMPYCPGGDLNTLRFRQTDRMFSPSVIKFYAAEIVLALEQLHEIGVVYRDLKPENVLIQSSGHVTLTDFDLSRSLSRTTVRTLIGSKRPSRAARVSPLRSDRSDSFVGTYEYVSPEVVAGEGHEFSVDWWALGILIYEMLHGTTPFKGKTRKETFRNILSTAPEILRPAGALSDLIGRLLHKDPTSRLGFCRGAVEIKEHEFFRGLRWDLLADVTRPPFIPAGAETEKSGEFRIRDYFDKLRCPPSSRCSFSDF